MDLTVPLVRDVDGRRVRPEVQRLLARMRARGVTSFEHLGVRDAREVVEAAVALEAPAPAVRHTVDTTVGHGVGGPVPVRIYRDDLAPDAGLVVLVHGGGWVTGSLETADATARRLAASTGHVVVSVGYRRSPETPFPGPDTDVVAAVRAAWHGRSELGVRSERLALVGESAGGSLVVAATRALRDLVTDQVLLYPALDPACNSPSHRENAHDPVLSHTDMQWFWDQYLGPGRPDEAAVAARSDDARGLPRTYVLTCGLDVLRDEGQDHARRLAAAGVSVTSTLVDGMTHGFLTMSRVLPLALDVLTEIGDWLREPLDRTSHRP